MCVESVLMQSGPNVRVLIIDDASPDNTAEVASELARKDCRVTFLRHAANKGHIATYNEGIERVSADYMLLLSADDYLLPGALSRAAKLMEANSEVGFIFGKAIDLTNSNSKWEMKTFANAAIEKVTNKTSWCILGGTEFLDFLKCNRWINILRTPTVVVRTELQKRLGGYRHELPHSGDLEMWLRLSACKSVGVINDYQAVYRLHGGNMQKRYQNSKMLGDLQQRKAAFDSFFECCTFPLEGSFKHRKGLLRHLSYEAVGYASHAFNDNEMDISIQLSEFAKDSWPEITKTLPWIMLVSKRRMGLRISRTLVPHVAWIRQTMSKLSNHDRSRL
jgi:glycosyltransferase involved in cell wall biosynthesis